MKNLTPHAVRVGDVIYPPSGQVARVVETPGPNGSLVIGEISGLQDLECPAIVSRPVAYIAAATKHPLRAWLLVAQGFKRDQDGNVVGCLTLVNLKSKAEIDEREAAAQDLRSDLRARDAERRKRHDSGESSLGRALRERF